MDYLKVLCDKNNVKLVYTDNKTILLSTSINKDLPNLRVHKIFKGCSEEIANYIADYYIYFKNKQYALSQIRAYISEIFKSDFLIKNPSKKFKDLLSAVNIKSYQSDDEVELKITNLLHKSSKGVTTRISPDQLISTNEDEIIELDITVNGI